jgi:energy-coupling factor transporter ATP-binding protein EcfA2
VAEPLVRIESLSYRYPGGDAECLRDLDLEIEPGELIVLAGRSGSGKTTLLRACCGLVPHYYGGEVSGEIEVGGLDVRDHGPAELGGATGLVAQDPETQVVSTTVRGELALPLEIRGEPPAARARAVEEAALALAIPHLLDRAADTLSGGELQRVALAAALVGRPRLVLLDEPTSQLDPVAGDELIGLLRRLNEEWGLAVVCAEHRLERCLSAADRVLALVEGRIAFDGEPGDFLQWALASDGALATPAARLFDLAGLHPPPTSVKAARQHLATHGVETLRRAVAGARDEVPVARCGPAAPAAPKPAGNGAEGEASGGVVLEVAGLWAELDDGRGPRDVLRGIDLSLADGERVALMGRNGAGKTTLLRAAAGLVEPVRGRIAVPRGCALLAQSPGDLLVRERVADELPGEAGRQALASVGLGWAAEADPRDLSGGERQRLALALVMAGRAADGRLPGLVSLDEPTRGMDRARKEELADWAGELAQRGASVVVATHDVEFASVFAERVVLLGDGELIADGPVAEILSGGWYFATEVARILGVPGAISPEQGAELLRKQPAWSSDEVAVDTEVPAGSGRPSSPAAAQPKASRRRSGSPKASRRRSVSP